MKETVKDRRVQLFYYVLAFILIWEWLKPVMVLTDTGSLWLFLTFVAISFIFGLLPIHWAITFSLKVLYIFWALHYAYMGSWLITPTTMVPIVQDLFSNIEVFVRNDWGSITNPMRTVLFFTLIWMTTYLIRYWIEVRKSILLFFAMTLIFITIMDTFSAYSAEGSIFIVLTAGTLLLGLVTVSRIAEKKQQSLSTSVIATMAIPLLSVIITGGVLSSLLPKPAPQWPDPVPFLTATGKDMTEGRNGRGGNTLAKSGYDTDDSALGGSFVQDETIVFEAAVSKKQYWKIETKNTYTSKGWEQVFSDEEQTIYRAGEVLRPLNDQEQLTAQLNMNLTYPFLIYPYGFSTLEGEETLQLLYSEDHGKYYTEMNGSEIALSSYSMTFQEQKYSLQALRETTMEDLETVDHDLLQYVQLPNELPERVMTLANEITAEERSVYEKAKAVERYFGRNGFVYDTQNIAKPGEGQDYVDQFLFDTKRGYCDNFSTSMVVMLRSVGIPARWVKGFAPGEETKNEFGDKVYRVTNAEAHSWVEAYMPGIGWMPFEPTIGFTSTASVTYDLDLERTPTEKKEEKETKKPERPKREEKPVASNKTSSIHWVRMMKWGQANMWLLLTVFIFLVGAVALGYTKRSRWMPKFLVWRYREMNDWNDFEQQYHHLLRQLERCGIKRPPGMTLMDYAVVVDHYYHTEKMSLLTAIYEKGVYGRSKENNEWANLYDIWKELINRTAG